MPRKGQRRYKHWLHEGFPAWLQERLVEREWLAVELAERIGVNSGVISNYMNGSRQPDPKMLQRIADVLEVADEEVFSAAGYLRQPVVTDDPRRLELVRRLQSVELTPDRYAMLSTLLAQWQPSRPQSTGKGSDAESDPGTHSTDQVDDRSADRPRPAPRYGNTRLERVG